MIFTWLQFSNVVEFWTCKYELQKILETQFDQALMHYKEPRSIEQPEFELNSARYDLRLTTPRAIIRQYEYL